MLPLSSSPVICIFSLWYAWPIVLLPVKVAFLFLFMVVTLVTVAKCVSKQLSMSKIRAGSWFQRFKPWPVDYIALRLLATQKHQSGRAWGWGGCYSFHGGQEEEWNWDRLQGQGMPSDLYSTIQPLAKPSPYDPVTSAAAQAFNLTLGRTSQ